MSIRTTVTLDDDVMDRVQRHARSTGKPFKEALNELLRTGLLARESRPAQKRFRIKPFHMGYRRELNYDDVESLLEYLEGPLHR
jgi:hypothetical protein